MKTTMHQCCKSIEGETTHKSWGVVSKQVVEGIRVAEAREALDLHANAEAMVSMGVYAHEAIRFAEEIPRNRKIK